MWNLCGVVRVCGGCDGCGSYVVLCVCVVGVMDAEPVCGGNFKGCDLTYERNLNNLFCKNLFK